MGKSLLAVHIAEAVARTQPSRRIIYLDLERTAAQFAERYLLRTAGRRPRSYRFARNFRWSGLQDFVDVPEQYRRDRYAFLRDCVCELASAGIADVLVIDSLSHLVRSPGGGRETRVLRMLRSIAAATPISILAVASAKPPRHPRPVTLNDLAAGPSMADAADSVFALGPSSMGTDIRYLKHLKSRSGPVRLDQDAVAAYRIGRLGDTPARALGLSGPQALAMPGAYDFDTSQPHALVTSQPHALGTSQPHALGAADPNAPGVSDAPSLGMSDPRRVGVPERHALTIQPAPLLLFSAELLRLNAAAVSLTDASDPSPNFETFPGLFHLGLSPESEHLSRRSRMKAITRSGSYSD